MFPKMEIESPGPGVTAVVSGQVTEVSPERIVAGGRDYPLIPAPNDQVEFEDGFLPWPIIRTWQEPSVMPGENVSRRQLLASGTTHIYFQANVRVFTALVFIIGIAMGMGMAAVYKYIPNYFPEDVGVVGGIVGVLGGLGGSLYPIFFGALLDSVGLWTGTWMFLLGVTTVCLVWLNTVVRRMSQRI
jgi:NNP family nitrate/nitrite transporter-like MFS transporter